MSTLRPCPNCGGYELSTTIDTMINTSAPGHGQLSASDVRPVVVVGCVDCSETFEVVEVDDPRVQVSVRPPRKRKSA